MPEIVRSSAAAHRVHSLASIAVAVIALCWFIRVASTVSAAGTSSSPVDSADYIVDERPLAGAPVAAPIDADAYDVMGSQESRVKSREPEGAVPRLVNFQIPADVRARPRTLPVTPPGSPIQPQPAGPAQQPASIPPLASGKQLPCPAAPEKPLAELGINIALPSGELPTDHGAACLSSMSSPGAIRNWPAFVYWWDATCLFHRPLYFEEINLERYGYGCACCLQPAASAAHFFATVPALPYCMAADCPHECVYTLGHYRPGSCPPWRYHWPPCEPLAAAAEAGVLTGMIFLIP